MGLGVSETSPVGDLLLSFRPQMEHKAKLGDRWTIHSGPFLQHYGTCVKMTSTSLAALLQIKILLFFFLDT